MINRAGGRLWRCLSPGRRARRDGRRGCRAGAGCWRWRWQFDASGLKYGRAAGVGIQRGAKTVRVRAQHQRVRQQHQRGQPGQRAPARRAVWRGGGGVLHRHLESAQGGHGNEVEKKAFMAAAGRLAGRYRQRSGALQHRLGAGSAGRACVPRRLTRSHYAIGLPASCNRWLAGRQCHCRASPGVDHEKRRPLMSAAGVWGNDGACLAGAQAIKSLQRRSLEAGGLARGDAHQPVVALVDDRHGARQLDRLGVLGF